MLPNQIAALQPRPTDNSCPKEKVSGVTGMNGNHLTPNIDTSALYCTPSWTVAGSWPETWCHYTCIQIKAPQYLPSGSCMQTLSYIPAEIGQRLHRPLRPSITRPKKKQACPAIRNMSSSLY
ncbi:hypothetical protein J1614_006945 [Plenodomus biglobosus]|nr:hypothetical protein J1614_006945 [Plenodomus biglobosus]